MRFFGRRIRQEVRVYFTGGTTAVLMGWRASTFDVDLRFEPELDEFFRAIPEIKEKLHINIELAAPSDFIPSVPGRQDRCKYIGREGKVSFFHYYPYSQALSKIERRLEKDILDAKAMLDAGLIEKKKLLGFFHEIEPQLYRYPAIDPKSFAEKVKRFCSSE
jgi:hypothetical protein